MLMCVFLVVQALGTRFAVYASARLGEQVFAELREEFLERVIALPLTIVERAGSGDIVTRMTRDVNQLSLVVRRALPDVAVSVVIIIVTMVGIVLSGPLLVLSCLLAVPLLWTATRWYLARAVDGYLREGTTYSELTEALSETVEGAPTIEALRLGHRRIDRVDHKIAESYAAERYTLMLRSIFLPITDIAFLLPVVATLLIGGWLHLSGLASVASVTAATLYTHQLVESVDRLLFWLNPLQSGAASFARILGVGSSSMNPDDGKRKVVGTVSNDDARIVIKGVCYAYREHNDVLHDIYLEIVPRERLAIVGPSGAGKSTLARLLAGIHRPRTGSITIGGTSVSALPLEVLRRQIMLVTQEHHVFRASLRDNLSLAKPDATDSELEEALRALDAWDWAAAIGFDAQMGSGGKSISPAQAQQLALVRVLLADPRTLVLDEATSSLHGRSARQIERSLAAVLEGRTVISVAHQMHTAKDADRVAVMVEGRIQELGPHEELVADGKEYAALWRAWSSV